jgi:dTDP-4-dehydrorhamnose reductase
MRILILGGDGMLGHQLFKSLSSRHDVRVTLRQRLSAYKDFNLFSAENAYEGIEVGSVDRLIDVLGEFQPEAVVNAVGIVKQRSTAKESIPSLEINSLFPHRLAGLCRAMGIRMVHMSTDCVFSGRRGSYQETDGSDAEDLYGRTKYLGEVYDSHCVTLRTSMIGRELSRKQGLLEWFLSQRGGSVQGFKNALFSGFTTLELSRIIEKILMEYPEKGGLYHVSSDPISKFDLLTLIKRKMGLRIEIIPTEEPRLDRSLDSTRFRKNLNYTPRTWEEMIGELSMSLKEEQK